MRRLAKVLVTVAFPLLLLAYPFSILLPVEPAEIENVALDAPKLSPQQLLSPSFYVDAFRYARDASPMRAALIRLGAGLDFWVFDDSPDPRRVMKGLDDWLYFSPTFTRPCSAPSLLVAENLIEFVRRLEMDVPTVVLTVSPSKFIIHPEHLTEEQRRFGKCAQLAGKVLRERLASSSLHHYVDGWHLFESLRMEGVEPYFATDTHFNYEGSIPWMKSLIEQIAPIWDPNEVRDLGEALWLGNLTQFIGLDQPEEVAHVVVERDIQTEIEEIGPRTSRYRNTGGSELISQKTVVLGDSFLDLPRASFAQYFADVTIVDWRDDDAIGYFLDEVDSSEIVLIEVSELDVWPRFDTTELLDRYESVP